MRDDLATVRMWSRLAASALAGLIVFASSGALRAPMPEGPAGVGAIDAVLAPIEVPPTRWREPPLVPPDSVFATVTSAAPTGSAAGAELRLWSYGVRGEIVFENAEQFSRCVEARQSHREAPDCPSATETAEMRLDRAHGR